MYSREKISNIHQVGGIESSVIDSGSGKGVRIAWVNTGTGLRFKVVLDRAMDIADAFYNAYSLSWLSNRGILPPGPFSDSGTGWLDTFGGGLLVTCGLSHTGGPEEDHNGRRGLHGRISNTPAEIESVLQPDPASGNLKMSITGNISEARVFGPGLKMRRTLSAELGKAEINLRDEITNTGNEPAPHMLLYHCNFGWPLADEGAEIFWEGAWKARDRESELIFNKTHNFRICPPVLKEHNGAGEAAAFIDIDEDGEGRCRCGLINRKIGIRLSLSFNKAQLPWLINWQHWAKGEYVTGLEPATHPPIGQKKAGENGTLIYLQPGEKRVYDLRFSIENI